MFNYFLITYIYMSINEIMGGTSKILATKLPINTGSANSDFVIDVNGTVHLNGLDKYNLNYKTIAATNTLGIIVPFTSAKPPESRLTIGWDTFYVTNITEWFGGDLYYTVEIIDSGDVSILVVELTLATLVAPNDYYPSAKIPATQLPIKTLEDLAGYYIVFKFFSDAAGQLPINPNTDTITVSSRLINEDDADLSNEDFKKLKPPAYFTVGASPQIYIL